MNSSERLIMIAMILRGIFLSGFSYEKDRILIRYSIINDIFYLCGMPIEITYEPVQQELNVQYSELKDEDSGMFTVDPEMKKFLEGFKNGK